LLIIQPVIMNRHYRPITGGRAAALQSGAIRPIFAAAHNCGAEKAPRTTKSVLSPRIEVTIFPFRTGK
jgi:hypothetical protein